MSKTTTAPTLQPHAWSHACTALDGQVGQLTVVINGKTTHSFVVPNDNFVNSDPVVFEKTLVLGVWQIKLTEDQPNRNQQSEASVANLNVFSGLMSVSQMEQMTLTGNYPKGDHLSWSEAAWELTGSVETIQEDDSHTESHDPNLHLMSTMVQSWSDCMNLCPRLQSQGRVPLTPDVLQTEHLVKRSRSIGLLATSDVWSSYSSTNSRPFIDFYTGSPPATSIWVPGEPNGGEREECTAWRVDNRKGTLMDVGCQVDNVFQQCLCHFPKTPVLRLRGLCKGSNIDIHYTLKAVNGSKVFLGSIGTVLSFSPTRLRPNIWSLAVNAKSTEASTSAQETSYILGRHTWTITNDTISCQRVAASKRILKMTSCSDGQFTCRNGDCVSMAERCDQVLNCPDESDEVNCNVVVLKDSYRKTAPPVSITSENRSQTIVPAFVKVTLTLLDISAIRETKNELDIKFTAEFEWTEPRALYHNLKMETDQNTLEKNDIDRLWIPNLIYRNNKDNDDTRSGLERSKLKITRKGPFSRSGLDVLDEMEIFKGEQNPIIMHQSYTKSFKCKYNLRVFPFDTQVNKHHTLNSTLKDPPTSSLLHLVH